MKSTAVLPGLASGIALPLRRKIMRIVSSGWKRSVIAAMVTTACLLALHASASAANPGPVVKPGIVVKSRTAATLYFVTPGRSLAGIPSSEVYNCLKLSGQNHYNMRQDEIDALKKTDFLVRDPEGRIYLIEGTTKRHISSPAAFERNGYDPKEVVTISKEKLNCIADGKPVQ